MFPKLLQRLFANEGAGPKLRTDILPLDNKTLGVNGEGAVAVQRRRRCRGAVVRCRRQRIQHDGSLV